MRAGNTDSDFQPSQKRKAGSLKAVAATKLSYNDQGDRATSSNTSQADEKPSSLFGVSLSLPPSPSPLKENLVLRDLRDVDFLTSLVQKAGAVPNNYPVLEIHLDASRYDEFTDYRLSVALKALHPLYNGINPHHFRSINLVMKGNVLYTRYHYYLATPALSGEVGGQLGRFVTVGLAQQDKADLAYKVNITEKSVANALFGIRGVGQILITGKGKMEDEFAELLKDILVEPPEASIVVPDSLAISNSNPPLYGEGTAKSKAYLRKQAQWGKANQATTRPSSFFKPYPTRTLASSEYDFSLPARELLSDPNAQPEKRFLVDEKTQLVEHLLGTYEADALEAAIQVAAASPRPRQMMKFVVEEDDVPNHTKRRNNSLSASRLRVESDEGKLCLKKMVRISPVKTGKKETEIYKVPTEEEAIYLGWKIR
ncbi:hypothetical protein GQ44DRAFT_727844 [Phaeosphaeriaceae sp. PMI808]|nr:hypothetical protein GQ44DRAFT_727844 [Phaeosphaeriaceae sp. PMI808]